MPEAQALPWTLRFTEWSCGHHGQRPEDIPCASPEQAKAILWAIACAISQPGYARATLFNDERGIADIYLTDDHLATSYGGDFNPDKINTYYRPEVVLCADQATADAILAPELKQAREEGVRPDLMGARLWDGKDLPEARVCTNESVLTLLPRAQVEKLAEVDDTSLDPVAPLFELPPIFYDGAQVLEKLRAEAASIAAYEAELAAERAAEAKLDPTTDNHEADTEP